MDKLVITNLSAEAEGNEILKNLSLTVNKGDMLALLGPNGHGKSTLLNVLMGSPRYHVTSGSVTLDGEDLLKESVDTRSKKGLFMAFQNPPDVPGVVTMDFFRASINAHQEKPVSLFSFYKETTKAYEEVGLDSSMASRHLNEGYSGGEKKRNEILQMLLLKPSLVFLDEIDSGLDVDALALIAKTINELKAQGTTFIVISHYDRLYDLITPNRTAVMVNGRIALEGDMALAKRISTEGYSFLEKEDGISLAKEEKQQASIGECAIKQVINK
ncbi:MAG: Fe-S cluster assembly ATPase SufC [Bacilli bacterium]|jgi:Fe-S cluster assembly ATP-binding protein|nr:Fe-S cluster assembly ATPase SufC [Bacilli bacterium]